MSRENKKTNSICAVGYVRLNRAKRAKEVQKCTTFVAKHAKRTKRGAKMHLLHRSLHFKFVQRHRKRSN